jgi:uncharacterized membrane protein YjjP (DUF1212 family)
VRAEILPRWGTLLLQADVAGVRRISEVPADPTDVNMNRVTSTMRLLERLATGRLSPDAVADAIGAVSRASPAPTWLIALSAAAGAVALAVIFGIQHLPAAAIVFVSAGAGALLRRVLARYSSNVFLQPFCAALLAGVIGAIAVRYQLSSSLRLVAVCPCMILMPGPHVLNGALDLIKGRIHLGAARALFAALVIVTISFGLLIGLAVLGVSLPVDESGRAVPLWEDVIAAGVAVAAYSVFYSTPSQMFAWPIFVGMLAHALRWAVLVVFGASLWSGAFVACLVAGLILTPIARRLQMPFAAIGFAAVVSMIPGVYLFRMASGLLFLADGSHTTLLVISATLSDAITAGNIILAMCFGLIVPKLAIDRFIG